jgi:CheY-like chemotaxis protein
MASKKILVVDDSETTLMIEKWILNNDGYEVTTASDGRDGIAKALQLKPDLILMDVLMPQMNGFEAVKKLRQERETRSVPILMVTSQVQEESMQAGYENGCSDYIIKPIDRIELLTKVRSFLGE